MPLAFIRPMVCRHKSLVAFFHRVHSSYFDGTPQEDGGSGADGGSTSAAPTAAPVPGPSGSGGGGDGSGGGSSARASALRSGTADTRSRGGGGGSSGGGGGGSARSRSSGVAPEADDPTAVEAAVRRAEEFARRIFSDAGAFVSDASFLRLTAAKIRTYLQAHPEETDKQLLLGKSFTWASVFEEMGDGPVSGSPP